MKRLIVFALCLIMITSCGILVSAETTPTIALSNPTALPGKEVTVDISISNNPGIMAMSFCITYDNTVFEYVEYEKGYLSNCTLKDHTEKGKIAFVNDESSDKTNNGVMVSLKFRIKDDAAVGKYTITIANQNREKYGSKLHNSFSNSNMKYIVPNVIAGSITVDGKCEDVGHRYGNWETITPAGCSSLGEKERVCEKCGEPEKDEIPFTHDFEEEWTVDKAATPTEDGIMSRHCKNCATVTDEVTFTYEEVEDSKNPDDTSSDQSSSSSEQNSSSNSQNSSSNSQSSTSSSQSSTSSSQSSTSSSQSSTSSSQNSTSSSQNSTSSSQNSTSSSQNSTSSSQNSNAGSQSGTATNTTTSNEDSTVEGSSSNKTEKTPINNNVGSKNPLSAVENIKDYQENVKNNTDNDKQETTDTSSVVSEDTSEVGSDSSDDTSSQATNATEEKTALSSVETTALIAGAVLSLLIIVGAILLILKRKNKQ